MSVFRCPFAVLPIGALFVFTACPVADSDGDGSPDDVDCAPNDSAIYPGAPEVNTDQVDADCDGDTTDTSDVGDDDSVGDDDDDMDPGDLDSASVVTGDWSCKGQQNGDLVTGAVGTLNGTVADFESDDPVAGAHVEIWPLNNPESGSADASAVVTEDDGTFILEGVISSCQPYAVRVYTEFDPPETYQTYQVNFIHDSAGPWNETFNSVAYSTYNLLPLTVGVEPQVGRGIAAGSLYDCQEQKIANAEVSIGTLDWSNGAVTEADGYAMRYFYDESPDGDQMWVSEDGLFGGMNVPPGDDLLIMVWGLPQEEAHCELDTAGNIIRPTENPAMCLLATQGIYVIADSVNIANVRLQPWPTSCVGAVDGR